MGISSIHFQMCSFFYMVLLIIVYFSKKRLITFENKIYIYMIISNLIGLILDIFSVFTIINLEKFYILNYIITRFYLVYLILWITFFSVYIFCICIKGKYSSGSVLAKQKRIFNIFMGIFFLLSAIILVLPLQYYNKGGEIYSYGLSATFVYVVSAIYILVSIFVTISNYKSLKKVKCLPLLIYLILFPSLLIIQLLNPSVLLVTSVQSFITFLMYFTIENPDIQMIEDLNIAKVQAEKANNVKTEFLTNMSHEIRTPLNAITGFSQALSLEEDLKEKAREDVNDILMASTSLLEIVNSILDISKIETNNLEIVKKEYEIESLFQEVILLTNARIGNKPIEFRITIDPNIPKILYGDQQRLKQVIINLLTNAAKYTDKGFIEFKVDSVIKDGICRLIISVIDSGIGIEKDKLNDLFNKFEKFDQDNEVNITGSGIGLSLTKKILNLMGGTIVVESEYGKGSKFIVAVDQLIVSIEKEAEKKEDSSYVEVLTDQKKRILVVEDDLLNIRVVQRLLDKEDYIVETVNNGYDAINKIKSGILYDIIFMDIMMPKMSGDETLDELKKINDFNIPVIALTANAISGMREHYISLGFNDYLAKPIEKSELDKILRRYL